ncbi:MAG TPA: hypothetical protein PL141_10100 [Thermoflexales bacterium]|nr:hypothetical protein [Thermoflexales bacterium]
MATQAKLGLTFCVLAMLCACGGATPQSTPTALSQPASTPVVVASATSKVQSTKESPATPTAAPKPTDAPTPAPTPEIKAMAPEQLVQDLKDAFTEANLPLQFVKRSNGKNWNVFQVAGTPIYSFGAIGPDAAKGITDGSQYPGLPLAKMQELVDKAMKEYAKEGGDPAKIEIQGIPLPELKSFVTLYTGTNIEAQKAMRAARSGKSGSFSGEWKEDGGGFTYVDSKHGLVIRIVSQVTDPFSNSNDLIFLGIDHYILNSIIFDSWVSVKIPPSRMYLMLADVTGRRPAKDFNAVVKTINDAAKGKYEYSLDNEDNLTLKIK